MKAESQVQAPSISLNLHLIVCLFGPESNKPFFRPPEFPDGCRWGVSYSHYKNHKGQSSHSISSGAGNVCGARHK